ncbi:hypothetical protein ACKWTF_000968 [Chironomus riparius]
MNLDAEYGEYREYIEEFAKTIDPHDQLPLRVSGYCLRDYEIHGEIIEWLLIYLGRSCPTTLRIYLIQTALKKILEKVQDAPEDCGYDSKRDIYQPLKLVRVVVAVVNSLIFDLQDNAKLYEVPLPPTSPNASELTKLKQPPKISVDAIKNTRRTMEDKHVIIDDFNGYFNTQDTEPTFYYGIFDGHSGSDAATYANSHLNYNISVHPSYPSDIKKAMSAAFLVTDIEFLKKANAENLNSGTTALCAIYRKIQKKLYIGWCGDSQALIARLGNVHQIVRKHSPEDAQERKRIEDLGGVVLYWSNSYRVNGSLAVSRAIGDAMHKPFVSAEPEIAVLDLDGEEDFFVMGCDGLWDSLTEDDIALTVYKRLKENPNSYSTIASELCSLAKSEGSRDNISVIVVYLKEPELIATQSWPSEIAQNKEIMADIFNPEPQPPKETLGNSDIMNNPFGEDIFMGKSTEITDLVMHPNQFENTMTNDLNTINNNLINNGTHDEDNFMQVENTQSFQPQTECNNPFTLNDDNNNSNNNFNNSDLGPETNVDPDDDLSQNEEIGEAAGGEKEKIQTEPKETDDIFDQVPISCTGIDDFTGTCEDFTGACENDPHQDEPTDKIDTSEQAEKESMESHQHIEQQDSTDAGLDERKLIKSNNEQIEQIMVAMNECTSCENDDEDLTCEEQFEKLQQLQQQYIQLPLENITENDQLESEEVDRDESMQSPFEDESICANEVNEEVAIQQQEQPLMTDLETIETAQEVVESDSSDDEWNYRKVEDNKEVDSIQTVEEHTEFSQQEQEFVESSIVEQEEKLVEDEEKTAPIEVTDHIEQLEENLAESDNKYIEEQQQVEKEVEVEQNQQEIVEEICKQEFVQDQEQLVESSIEIETDKDILEAKIEPVEEERHVLDDIEKDLQLEVDSEDTNDMDSQLNPEAKEFVPLSPVRNEFSSPPPENIRSPFINQILSGLGDAVVSQSPRKCDIPVMEDVQIPEENVFDQEADERAHEINLMGDNFQRIESPQEELNLKEAMQTDDKLEQGYKDDSQVFFEEEKIPTGDEYKELESSFDQYSNGFQSKIDDAMNRSFYEGRDNDILADPAKSILNTTQPLSDDEDSQANKKQEKEEIVIENNIVEQEQPNQVVDEEIDFLGSSLEPVKEQINIVDQFETLLMEKEPISQMESSDNFEAEKFVEEIKGINENFNKYVDTELSPTIPEAVSNVIQTVEETIFATHTSMKPIEETILDTFITETSQVSNLEFITEHKQFIDEELEIQQEIQQDIQPEIEIKENIPEVIEQVQQEELIPTMEAPAHEVSPPPVESPVQEPIVEEKPLEIVSETIQEPEKVVEQPQEDAKIESKVEEIVAAASVGIAAAAIGTAAIVSKKPSTNSIKKPDAKKVTDIKAKVPSKPAEIKKTTDLKPKTATTKPSPTTAKPPISKPAPARPTSSLTAAARPKSASTLPPIAKKLTPTSTSTPKPMEAKPKADAPKPARPASTLTKRPTISSAPATKPAPAKPITEVKPKVNGTTERKPLSSAPTTRAPIKPTSLTVKSASATTAKSPSATRPAARLSLSSVEKSASSPLKEKSLNKSLSGPATAKSPRPITSTSTTKTAVKTDLKSPSAPRPAVGVVGIKKPLTTVKKVSPTTEKTSTITSITKKPAAKPSSTAVKKTTTTTTTVIKKKVVNGDIVEETKNTTTESAEDVPALNGHHMNGNAENGVSHENEQQAIIESSAN